MQVADLEADLHRRPQRCEERRPPPAAAAGWIRCGRGGACVPMVAAAVLLWAMGSRADDFMATPGIWWSTLKSESAPAGGEAPQTSSWWRCVFEDADPWESFVPPAPNGQSCTRTPLRRTSTALNWQTACEGAPVLRREGSIVFDSATHYTGSILEVRVDQGRERQQRSRIEGWHRAACTSPAD